MHVYIDMPLSYADHQSVNFLSALGEHAPTLTTVQSWNHLRRREKAWSRWPTAFSQHVWTRVCLKMGYPPNNSDLKGNMMINQWVRDILFSDKPIYLNQHC